jgi:hypothetical protein
MVQILSTQSDHEMTANHTAAISVSCAGESIACGHDSIAGVLGGICRAMIRHAAGIVLHPPGSLGIFRNAMRLENDGTLPLPPYYR